MRKTIVVAMSAAALASGSLFAEDHVVTFRRIDGTILERRTVPRGGTTTLPAVYPAYQFVYATENVSASSSYPAPLPITNPSGTKSCVHTNHSYCATVKFSEPESQVEPDRVLYVPVAAGATNTLNAADVTSYITNIVKQGAGTLVASAVPGYAGDFTIEGGVYAFSNAGDFGKTGSGVVNVKSGASLEFKGGASNVLSGKTANLYGAKADSLSAKILFSNASARSLGSSVTIRLKDADEVFYVDSNYVYIDSGTIDLGGRELRIKSNANWRRMEIGATIVNGGSLVYDKCQFHCDGTRIPTLSAACASTALLKFVNGAEMNWKKLVPSNGWTLHCDASAMHGNIVRFPNETDCPCWDGPVVFAHASKAADWIGGYDVSNTVFNLKGAVSGSGSLTVGPGWLNLHNANNTYSGSVTVRGQWLESSVQQFTPILPGSGGIGLLNGAACFPNASSITFTTTARLAFMDNTKCSVPNVKFVALAGETQSISGGVYTARSTISGIVKEGAGTLVVDSPAQFTGLADIQAGTLKIAYSAPVDATQEGVLAPQPQFASLKFASGTTFDLSDNVGFVVCDLDGSPSVVMLVLAPTSGYAAWASEKNVAGKPSDVTKGIANAVRYAFGIDPAKGPSEIGTPIMQVVRDADGNPAVQTRNLAEGRSDVTFGILATSDLGRARRSFRWRSPRPTDSGSRRRARSPATPTPPRCSSSTRSR